MIKDVFMLHSADLPNELPVFERWYMRYHAPEVISVRGPSLVRFIGYRPAPVIREAEGFGYYNLRVTEAWFRSVQERPNITSNILAYTWRAPWAKDWSALQRPALMPAVACTVPTMPTEVFLGSKFSADEKPILRWYLATKYPEGVSVADGEEWFLKVHSQEVMQQPGLTAYFSHRAIDMPGRPSPWHRLTEQWYESFHGWRQSVIEAPPKYTRPPWATHDRYPFLTPYVDFASTFLLERPDHDYLREATPYP
jgi:hypothetical protein